MRNWVRFTSFFPILVGSVCFVFVLSACSQSSGCFREDVFCAGLVTDVLGIDDYGMNQDTWAGLQEAKANGLVDQIEYIESVDTRDYEKNITYFADNGYDVIVTTGVGMRDDTVRSANRYSDSSQGAAPVFIAMNQPQEEVHPNIIPVTFLEDQIGFAAGALAARISKTKIVGAACETSGIDSMWRYCEGFRAGAKFVDQKIKIQILYRDDGSSEKLFIDEAWGYDTGRKLIKRGADVIFAAGGATGQGALRAAVDAQVNAIGTERDQGRILDGSGSSVVTSILGSASFEVQNVLRLIQEGNVNQPVLRQIRYVPFNQNFPESLTQEMNLLLSVLSRGEITTGVPLEKP